jgi:hypothetical protein
MGFSPKGAGLREGAVVFNCSRKGPRVGDGHGEAEKGEADFRERCGYV